MKASHFSGQFQPLSSVVCGLSQFRASDYFVRPTEAELAYVAKADAALHALVEELCQAAPTGGADTTTRQNLVDWVCTVLSKRQLSASDGQRLAHV